MVNAGNGKHIETQQDMGIFALEKPSMRHIALLTIFISGLTRVILRFATVATIERAATRNVYF